jgi:undecaprenyl-diphosphatase
MRTLLLALALLGPVEQLDRATAAAVQGLRRPGLEAPMRAATRWGRPAAVAAVLALVVDAAAGTGWGHVAVAAVGVAGTNLVVEGLKLAVGRPRPDGDRNRANSSFPSSHAANAFAAACVLARRWRRGNAAFLALALVVAFSRMYLNRHFLSDVVAGAVIGAAFAWLAGHWLQGRLDGAGARPAKGERAPA